MTTTQQPEKSSLDVGADGKPVGKLARTDGDGWAWTPASPTFSLKPEQLAVCRRWLRLSTIHRPFS